MPGHMVVVGAGECGTRAAFALREAGFDGEITLFGAEPHLPYERPPLSKHGMTEGTVPDAKYITDDARLDAAGIAYRRGALVTGIDRSAQTLALDGGSGLPYDRLLLATGSISRRLSHNGAEVPHVLYLRHLDDARQIRARLVPGERLLVIGGGFIGLELAAGAVELGAHVTVVEVLPRVLARAVPAEIAAVITERHRAAGVDIITGIPIDAIVSTAHGARLRLAGGRVIDADLLVAGIGAIPVTNLAANAGLEIANGIAVDVQLATADPAIFAAGDCCSFPLPIYGNRRVRLESWRNAQEHGDTAARNMLGAGTPHAAVPWFWSDQYDLSLQMAGLADEGRTTVRRDLGDGTFILFHLADDGRLVAASGIGPGNAVARDIRLAEMLIGKATCPDAGALADRTVKLKSMLVG
jgi:3-phenylpropionate/trans-cinnamate dioxygenase ferredoxin reductase subunit